MTEVEVVGDVFPVTRVATGLYSLDRALGFRGELGVPLRSLFELYGHEASGKSTLAWFISSKVNPKGKVWVADLEGTLDKSYIKDVMTHAGFSGTVRVANYANTDKRKPKLRSHEEQLQDAVDALLETDVSAAVIDSIGMFWPVVDVEKNLGERSMGQRAKTIADASRRVAAWLRIADDAKLCFYINHVHPNIGGRGFSTPGGVTKSYAANVRVWLQRIDNDVPEGSGNFLAEARVQKLKAGGASAGRKGLVYFIPGYGVSVELTNVFDCISLGIAKRETVVRLKQFNVTSGEFEWRSMGRLSELAEKALDAERHVDFFDNFARALVEYEAHQNG